MTAPAPEKVPFAGATSLPATPVVDPGSIRLVQELKHSSPLIGCRFDPTGKFVFASAQDNTIQRWELLTGRKIPLVGHKSWVRGIAFDRKTGSTFTGGYTGQILGWKTDAARPLPTRTILAHHGWVRALAVSPDGSLLASCGNDHLVRLWSTSDGKLVRELTGHSSHVYNVAFHPNGRYLVSGDLKGVVKHWDLGLARPVRDLDAGALHKYDPVFLADIGGIRSMAFNADGTMLGCAGISEVTNAFAGVGKPLVLLFNWETGKITQSLVPKENFQGTAWGIAFHPQGFVIGAGGGNGGVLWFWKPTQAQAFFTFKLPNNARDLDLHPDKRRIAIAFFDGAVRIYDIGPKKSA